MANHSSTEAFAGPLRAPLGCPSVSVTVHILEPDEWERWREVRLAALAEAPYAFGSTLAEWSGVGDTEARWRQRLTDVPYNVVATSDDRLCGMASGTAPVDGVVDLLSFWVTPEVRGLGVGDLLVTEVVSWARRQGAHTLALCVRVGNDRATAFYLRHGFLDAGPVAWAPPEMPERRMTLELRAAAGDHS